LDNSKYRNFDQSCSAVSNSNCGITICATVNVSNKIEYAEENGYTFYLNGKDITDSVEQCDPMSYDVSLEKWDEHVVLLSTR